MSSGKPSGLILEMPSRLVEERGDAGGETGHVTAFVLGGGGSLGAVQVGMLRALLEAGVRPDMIVGSSIGALNGAFLAGHPDLFGVEALADVWMSVHRRDVFPFSLQHLVGCAVGKGDHLFD
jgi:NTE family protein